MERNDLDEFLAMAELGDRDFTAERRGAVVVSRAGKAPTTVEYVRRCVSRARARDV